MYFFVFVFFFIVCRLVCFVLFCYFFSSLAVLVQLNHWAANQRLDYCAKGKSEKSCLCIFYSHSPSIVPSWKIPLLSSQRYQARCW